MQSIIAILIDVVNIDPVLGQHSHYITMADPGRNPKGIQAVTILLIDFDHLVFEHQSNKVFTVTKLKKLTTKFNKRIFCFCHLPSFSSRNFERKTRAMVKIYVIVKNAS